MRNKLVSWHPRAGGSLLKRIDRAAWRFIDRRARKELEPSLAATLEARRALVSLDDAALEARARAMRVESSVAFAFAEACALGCEIAARSLHLDPRPSQILAAAVLHRGGVAELPTGEGKTLAAALAAFVHALGGRSVHVVATNHYLASRDAAEMAPLFRFAGLTSAEVRRGAPRAEKRRIYRSSVVY
ncbi:MAG: hypothetical protein H5U40_13160, partial [Polyangiaceae bacterium]|nr:hypothetical protein [Polyangiaceae bacterium]